MKIQQLPLKRSCDWLKMISNSLREGESGLMDTDGLLLLMCATWEAKPLIGFLRQGGYVTPEL